MSSFNRQLRLLFLLDRIRMALCRCRFQRPRVSRAVARVFACVFICLRDLVVRHIESGNRRQVKSALVGRLNGFALLRVLNDTSSAVLGTL